MPAGSQRLPMFMLDDVEEVAALHGNSDVMRVHRWRSTCRWIGLSPDAPARFMIISASTELVALRVVPDDVVDQVLRVVGTSPALDADAQPDRLGVTWSTTPSESHEQDHRADTSIGTSPVGRRVTPHPVETWQVRSWGDDLRLVTSNTATKESATEGSWLICHRPGLKSRRRSVRRPRLRGRSCT